MKAVFLDRNTLSERIDVDIPKGVAQWVAFQKTAPRRNCSTPQTR